MTENSWKLNAEWIRTRFADHRSSQSTTKWKIYRIQLTFFCGARCPCMFAAIDQFRNTNVPWFLIQMPNGRTLGCVDVDVRIFNAVRCICKSTGCLSCAVRTRHYLRNSSGLFIFPFVIRARRMQHQWNFSTHGVLLPDGVFASLHLACRERDREYALRYMCQLPCSSVGGTSVSKCT